LIDGLLKFNPKKRLGAKGWAEIKKHAFFTSANFDWGALEEQRLKSPLLSTIKQYKTEYKAYDPIKMNPEVKLETLGSKNEII
jgi:hypothetical protein